MAITCDDESTKGHPSSWSAAIDATTSGYADDIKRLMIVSAGNVTAKNWSNYVSSNILSEVHDPGQAWNALTVGAYTKKIKIKSKDLIGFNPIAAYGGLSPFSSTSTMWNKWPIKPEVVFEGGNAAKDSSNFSTEHDDLMLLTTAHNISQNQFVTFGMTSAATALASNMAAHIQADYPDAWPETIRALIVHSAQWTEEMEKQFLNDKSKRDYTNLIRACGYGVPNLERAMFCASNSLTLIAQDEIQPFDKNKSGQTTTKDMNLYNLPWPIEILRDLGETPIEMRITLSYFVEPGPGEVGWDDRYRYPSHVLRFKLNSPNEERTEFVKRINKFAREVDEKPDTEGRKDWIIGDNQRNLGSIHSDIWKGKAVDLANSNLVAVYPATGWWRSRSHLNRWNKKCRYSLLVSIHTPKITNDIYVAVLQKIKPPIPIKISNHKKQ
jgi:hypothetical protein